MCMCVCQKLSKLLMFSGMNKKVQVVHMWAKSETQRWHQPGSSGQVTTVYCHTPGLPSIDISVNGIILIQFYSFYFNVNTELSQFILSVSVIQLISWIQQICLKQEELKNL